MDRYRYEAELMDMAASLDQEGRDKFIRIFHTHAKNPVELFGWNVWLGWLGVDRFIVGDILLGGLKLITLGGLGIWQIVDCFLIGNRTREKNMAFADQLYDDIIKRRV